MGYLGAKYVFAGWGGGVTSTNSGDSILMNTAHMTSAQWSSDYTKPMISIAALVITVCALLLVATKRGMMRRISIQLRTKKINAAWKSQREKIQSEKDT